MGVGGVRMAPSRKCHKKKQQLFQWEEQKQQALDHKEGPNTQEEEQRQQVLLLVKQEAYCLVMEDAKAAGLPLAPPQGILSWRKEGCQSGHSDMA